MKRSLTLGFALVVALLASAAAEGNKKVSDPATATKVRSAVEQHVKQEEQLKGGFFLRDPQEKAIRDLKFDHVHQGVEKTPDNRFVSCVDFVDQNNDRLDVDFYLEPSGNDLKVSKVKIHKVNGVERKNP